MKELIRNAELTQVDWDVAHRINRTMVKLGSEADPLRRVQAVQDDLIVDLEELANLKKPARKSNRLIRRAVEHAWWYERGGEKDPLTGLLTKFALYERLGSVLAEINRGVIQNVVIMKFDLNSFKSINDTYGHNNGDIIIKYFARAVSEIGRQKTDRAFREQAGGDEFYLLLGIGNEDVDLTTTVEKVKARLFAKVAQIMSYEPIIRWRVVDDQGREIRDSEGNFVYSSVGALLLNRENIGDRGVEELLGELHVKGMENKSSLKLKPR